MRLEDWATRGSSTTRIVGSSVVLALGLVLVVWIGYRTTSRELLTLLRYQALSLRQTVAAAARSNLEASRQAQSDIEARMLATAKMLVELDRRRVLDPDLLDELVRENSLFRVTVYRPDRQPEYESAATGGTRARRGFGPGFTFGFGGDLLDRLLSDENATEVTDIHVSRWGDWRGFAAVRRARGGAIVLNVDATAVEDLRSQGSLDALLADITESAEEVAYVVFEQDGLRIAHGDIPVESEPESLPSPQEMERERQVQGRPVLELAGPITVDESTRAYLRLGMRLDGVRRAEKRMLWQLGLSLAAGLALAVLGIGTVWLQRKYSLLSERHARAQEALRRRDRLAAMGELSSTVAHEIRNPLNAIAMSARRLKREFLEVATVDAEERTEAEELLGVLEEETRRIDEKVQQFLDYARPPRLTPRPTDLGVLARSVTDGARAMAGSRGLTMETEVVGSREAMVDPEQLRQVLENLVRNAVEATPEGGRVVVRVSRRADHDEIEVADSGTGISPEDLPRLFDLYFTTKEGGTGVGLAVTQQIVTAHGGTIEVESQLGKGTRMTVKLPRNIGEATA